MNRRAVFGMGAAIAVAAGAGCTSDFSLPDGAKILCDSDEQCPPETVCKAALGRCVDSKAETTAPEVTSKKVTPGSVRKDATVRVELTVSEPLDRDPVVRFSEPAEARPFVLQHLGAAEGGGERYLGLYTASDADAREGEAPVTREVVALQLIDRVGNVSPSASLGSVTFDYTAPRDPAVGIAQAPRSSTSKVTVTLSAEGADYVLLGGDLATPGGWEPFVASKEVELTSGEGARSLQARFKDEAGNETADVRASTVVDTLAPSGTLKIALQAGRSAAASNAVVSVDGAASGDAELAGAEVVSRDVQGAEVGRAAATGVQLVDGIFSGTVNVGTLPAGAAALALEVSVSDGASQAKLASDALPVDDAAPTGLTLAFASASPSPAFTASATVPVKLGVTNVGRADTSDLEMRFDPADLAAAEPSRGVWVPFAAERTLLLDGTADGSKTVQVQVRDGAHNPVGPATATITLDTKPPTQPGVWISGRPTDVGTSLVTLELSCLDAAQVLVAGDVEAVAGATFEWVDVPADGKLAVQLSGATGSKLVTAVYRDLAGNQTALVWYAVTLTSGRPPSAPTLAAPAGQARVKWGDALAIGGSAIPNATLESARLVFADASGQQVGQEPLVPGADVLLDLATGNFSGQITLAEASTPASAATVAVEAVIRRGGGTCPDDCSVDAESRSKPLRIDRHAPEAPSLIVVQGTEVNVDQVDVLLSDPVDADSEAFQVRVEGAGVANPTPAGTWLAFAPSASVSLTAGEGTKIVDVVYRDEADHRVKGQATVVFDTTAPQITAVSLQGGGGQAGKTNTWTVNLTVSASGGPSQLRVSGAGVSPGAYSDWTDHAFGAATPITLTAGDGAKAVTVECRDAAGNLDSDSSASIVLDTTPARLAVDLQLKDGPLGKTHVHGNDTGVLLVGGSANEAGCSLSLARLVGRTASGLTVLKQLDQGSEAAVDPATGALSGSFTLAGVDLTSYSAIALEVGVADPLGNPTPGGFVVSNEIPVDLAGPQGTALAKAAGQPDPTREKSFQVRASSTDAGPVWVCFFGADTVAGATACDSTNAAFVPLQSGSLTQTLSLVGKQGANSIGARFRDRSFLTVDQTVQLTFDDVPPTLTSLAWKAGPTTAALPDGTLASWDALGSVTLQARFDALPASLAISGDFDKASVPGCTGAECSVRFTACAGGVCEATLRLTASAVDGTKSCSDPLHAPGDGAKALATRPVDDAGNAGAVTNARILLDRTCPTKLVLDAKAVPQPNADNYVTATGITLFVATPSKDEDLVDYETRLNGGAWTRTGALNTSFAFTLVEGANTVEVRGVDVGRSAAAPITSYSVHVDTRAPSLPAVEPGGVVFNGERVPVFVTTRSKDPGGDANGADLTYEVLGGPFTDAAWHPVTLHALALGGEASVLLPYFEVGDAAHPLPQQQSTLLYVRARDKAGNASPGALLAADEQSTWAVHTSDVVSGTYGMGLWGDHLAWGEGGNQRVYYKRLPDGAPREIWSGAMATTTQEVQVKGQTVVFAGAVGFANSLYFYDLGADQVAGSGDETAYATNPHQALALDHCSDRTAFDFDAASGQVAYTKGASSDCTGGVSLYVMDVKTLAVQTVCTGCVGAPGVTSQVALSGGCVVYNPSASTFTKRCSGADGLWGTGDDAVSTLTGGACNGSFRYRNKVSLGRLGSELAAAWVQYDGSNRAGVCLWRESTGTASLVLQQPQDRDIERALVSGSSLFVLAQQPDTTYVVQRFDPAAGTFSVVQAIPAGAALSRMSAWMEHVALSRGLEGGRWQLETYQALDEKPLSAGAGDQLTPAVDGERVVWVDTSFHVCGEIVLADRATNTVRRLTSTPCPAAGPYPLKLCPRISGAHVVWQEYSAASRVEEMRCAGKLFGLADVSAAPLAAPVELSSAITYATPSRRVALSGDYVVFDAAAAATYNLYLYRWSTGAKPSTGVPLVASAQDPALDGPQLAFVSSGSVRACVLGVDCHAPRTVVPRFNGACGSAINGCDQKYSPRVRGSRVVWFDNRGAATEAASWVHYRIYEAKVADSNVAGTPVSTSPLRGPTSGGTPNPEAWISSGVITPELGPDFVAFTSVRDGLETGAGYASYSAREVAVVELAGPAAYVEHVVTRSDGRQTAPAVDGSGHVVWQDHRGGPFFQIYELTR